MMHLHGRRVFLAAVECEAAAPRRAYEPTGVVLGMSCVIEFSLTGGPLVSLLIWREELSLVHGLSRSREIPPGLPATRVVFAPNVVAVASLVSSVGPNPVWLSLLGTIWSVPPLPYGASHFRSKP